MYSDNSIIVIFMNSEKSAWIFKILVFIQFPMMLQVYLWCGYTLSRKIINKNVPFNGYDVKEYPMESKVHWTQPSLTSISDTGIRIRINIQPITNNSGDSPKVKGFFFYSCKKYSMKINVNIRSFLKLQEEKFLQVKLYLVQINVWINSCIFLLLM